MGQSLIGNIAVNLLMETAAFEQGATLAEKRLGKMSRKFEALGQSMVDLGQKLSLSVTAPIVGAGAAIIKMTGNFEASMNKVSISTQAGAADMKAMSELALKLGKDSEFGATTAADAMDMLAKNGLSARQILDGAAKATIALASAAGSELEPAASAITDVMQQFKLNTADLPLVVNQITGAVNESKLNFVDYATAIGQAGGVAGASGVDFVDFNAAIAGTSALFASGSDAGTSFKTFLIALTPSTKKAANIMKEYGLSFFDAQGNMRSMSEIAEELKTKLGGLSEEARTNTLKELFGTDAMRTAIGLMDQGAAGIDKIKKKIGETDAAAQSAKRLEGFNGQLEQLKGSIETLAIRIGQSGILEAVTTMVTGLSNLIDKWSEASPATLRFATVLGLVAAAVGPLVIAFGLLVQGIAPLIAAFSMISAAGGITAVFSALAGVLAPLLPVIAAVAAAGYLLYTNWDKIAPVLADLWKQAQETLGPPLQELVSAVTALFSELWNGPLGEGIRQAGAMLVGFAGIYAQAMGPVAIGLVKAFIVVLAEVFKQIGEGVRLVSALFSGDWSTAFSAAFQIVARSFLTLPTYVIGKVQEMVVGVRTWIVDKLGSVWGSVKTGIDQVKGWFFGLYDAVVGHSYIPDMVDGIAQNMARLDNVMVKPVKAATDKVKDSFKKLAEEVSPLLARLFPDEAALNAYRADLATLNKAEKGKAISSDTAEEARRRLALGGKESSRAGPLTDWEAPMTLKDTLFKGMGDLTKVMAGTAGGVEAANVRIVESFKDMAQNTLSSLQNLGNAIKSGGFLDIFTGVMDLLLQIGSIGGFGKTIQTNLGKGFGGMRANGGPVVPGKSYIVGERGPEWFTPGGGGAITPMGGGGGVNVTITPSAYFDATVDNRAARVAGPMAVAGSHMARQGAQSDMMARRRRVIPG